MRNISKEPSLVNRQLQADELPILQSYAAKIKKIIAPALNSGIQLTGEEKKIFF